MNEVFLWRDAPRADFAVIGDPVAHSLSPAMHSAAYSALGLNFRYVAIHVPVGEVGEALDRLAGLGYRGVNVTVPHKEEVLSWASAPEPFAILARAANTIRLADGWAINTDAPGFIDTISHLPITTKVLLIGAGGSSRALAIKLVESGFDVSIQNRTHAKAEEIGKISGATVVETLDPRGFGLIVNTTSASLQGTDLPIQWELADKDAVAYDLAYAPGRTAFMRAAENHGIRAMDGRELLVAQGALAFEWWLGQRAPREAMREALL